jgi:hypothetical protein
VQPATPWLPPNAEEIACFVFALGPMGMEVVRKDCSEEEIISRGKGRTLVLAIETLTRTPSPANRHSTSSLGGKVDSPVPKVKC